MRGRIRAVITSCYFCSSFSFLQSLAEGPENVVGLCTFKEFSDKFVSMQPIPTNVCLPPSLRTLYRDTHEKLDRAYLMAKCWVHKQTGVTEQQRKCAEMVTRSQSACPVWHEERVGRITASTAHAALRAIYPMSKSLITRICKPSTTTINTPAIVWGRQHEDEVFSVYTDIVTGTWSHVACTTSDMTSPSFLYCGSPFHQYFISDDVCTAVTVNQPGHCDERSTGL